MAARNNKITLNLDFNVEKAKLQEIGNIISRETSKAFDSSKGNKYYANIESAIRSATKEATGLYSQLNKPLRSKKEAVDLGKALEKLFSGLNDKVISLLVFVIEPDWRDEGDNLTIKVEVIVWLNPNGCMMRVEGCIGRISPPSHMTIISRVILENIAHWHAHVCRIFDTTDKEKPIPVVIILS